jgi:hypothetical protein
VQKGPLFHRVAEIVARLRTIRGLSGTPGAGGKEFLALLATTEGDLDALEHELAVQIDDYMAERLYRQQRTRFTPRSPTDERWAHHSFGPLMERQL